MRHLFLAGVCLAIAACDDDPAPAVMLGGGSGGTPLVDSNGNPIVPSNWNNGGGDVIGNQLPAGDLYTGQSFSTVSSEFGWVDGPQNGGNGDPGTSGNWYTGAGGQYIGGQDSTGASLPAATEIAIYGSTKAAQNQPIQIENLSTGQTVTTTIVDVGPGRAAVARGVGVDLTYGTARDLGFGVNQGGNVIVTPLKKSDFTQ